MAGWAGGPASRPETCDCHLDRGGPGAGDDLAQGPGPGPSALAPACKQRNLAPDPRAIGRASYVPFRTSAALPKCLTYALDFGLTQTAESPSLIVSGAPPTPARPRRQAGRARYGAVSGNRAIEAVKVCRKFCPPTGPSSPAQKNPATGILPSLFASRPAS